MTIKEMILKDKEIKLTIPDSLNYYKALITNSIV